MPTHVRNAGAESTMPAPKMRPASALLLALTECEHQTSDDECRQRQALADDAGEGGADGLGRCPPRTTLGEKDARRLEQHEPDREHHCGAGEEHRVAQQAGRGEARRGRMRVERAAAAHDDTKHPAAQHQQPRLMDRRQQAQARERGDQSVVRNRSRAPEHQESADRQQTRHKEKRRRDTLITVAHCEPSRK